jgi:hypothetical protein
MLDYSRRSRNKDQWVSGAEKCQINSFIALLLKATLLFDFNNTPINVDPDIQIVWTIRDITFVPRWHTLLLFRVISSISQFSKK